MSLTEDVHNPAIEARNEFLNGTSEWLTSKVQDKIDKVVSDLNAEGNPLIKPSTLEQKNKLYEQI